MQIRPTILLLAPFDKRFHSVQEAVMDAAGAVGAEVLRVGRAADNADLISTILDALQKVDLVIADVSYANPSIMYEVGLAHAIGKPCLVITRNAPELPFDLSSTRYILYDLDSLLGREMLRTALSSAIGDALKHPTAFSGVPIADSTRNSVVISYSHKDKAFLLRLLVHLRPLEKDNRIDLWVDTKLTAGDEWKEEISKALDRARVAILLVSADFLASNFIVDNELPPILANAKLKGTRIIPVIVGYCRFIRDVNLNGFHALNDPARPLACMPESEQEAVYDQVAEAVELALGAQAS